MGSTSASTAWPTATSGCTWRHCDRTGLVVVSANGIDSHVERSRVDVVWNAADVVAAYA
ncbi:hypothetical protein [Phytoactinopolyspora halotolerans]|uniref:Uncharacterized protein n=1 Tax=Phytoactinopolyspora halotolerans TaxID=1981512 RepID=A0A6L9S866_9ACTN|nr:hypothetical protein [Phytoactinopolyspora halotolerans]NEE01237.1 hypothetical protein [Phytoactinopolyspora halotolerans]